MVRIVDDETMQKIIAVGLILLMFGVWMTYSKIGNVSQPDSVGACADIIDTVYEQCSEEGHINLTTIQGRSKVLEYTNGICVIK